MNAGQKFTRNPGGNLSVAGSVKDAACRPKDKLPKNMLQAGGGGGGGGGGVLFVIVTNEEK